MTNSEAKKIETIQTLNAKIAKMQDKAESEERYNGCSNTLDKMEAKINKAEQQMWTKIKALGQDLYEASGLEGELCIDWEDVA